MAENQTNKPIVNSAYINALRATSVTIEDIKFFHAEFARLSSITFP